MKKDEDKILNGNYDGIQEYDNDLPQWWLWLFYITILAAIVYPVWYHIYPGQTNEITLAKQMSEIEALRAASDKALVASGSLKKDESALLALLKDSSRLEQGKAVYTARCAMCHAAEGQGLIGPNLTDNYWIHGAKLEQMRTIVENGVADKGMLAWKGILTPDEIDSVVAFISSLHGTNPANPKAPQGELVQP
jgi:cytochrome c oxidase cbb3-type subunit 3